MKSITINGVDYELVKASPKPKFKKYDVVQHAYGDDGHPSIITEVASDRYYTNDSPYYILITDQHKYNLVGQARLVIDYNQ